MRKKQIIRITALRAEIKKKMISANKLSDKLVNQFIREIRNELRTGYGVKMSYKKYSNLPYYGAVQHTIHINVGPRNEDLKHLLENLNEQKSKDFKVIARPGHLLKFSIGTHPIH